MTKRKRTNSDLQNNTQKNNDRATRNSLKDMNNSVNKKGENLKIIE
jgi:hypothetical protein